MGRGASKIGSNNPTVTTGSGGGWKADYDKAIAETERLRAKANAMDSDVKAARDAYNAAPTRTKAQKQERERLYQKASELSLERDKLLYRSAYFATIADRIRMENDTRYRNKKNKEQIAELRRHYR